MRSKQCYVYSQDQALLHCLRRGDIVATFGFPSRTKRGDLTVVAEELKLLAPCYHDLPSFNNFRDRELRYRKRHVDMLVNRSVNEVFHSHDATICSVSRPSVPER